MGGAFPQSLPKAWPQGTSAPNPTNGNAERFVQTALREWAYFPGQANALPSSPLGCTATTGTDLDETA
jgi:hypothetical protein